MRIPTLSRPRNVWSRCTGLSSGSRQRRRPWHTVARRLPTAKRPPLLLLSSSHWWVWSALLPLHLTHPPLASGCTACSNMLHVGQANSVSRGDEAIAAAEVLVLRDELESSRRKEAVTAQALGERSEVSMPVQRTSELSVLSPAWRTCSGAGMRHMDDFVQAARAGACSATGARW